MLAPDPTFLTLQSALAGEYSLERELGRGGMGIVFLAREVVLDRLVAIKALPAEMTARDDVRDRFLREARTAASLSHPNIVPIHRVGEANGIPYFVMTFVNGQTLGERLRARGPIGPTLLTRVLRDVALALGYAHGRGVIDRCLERVPANRFPTAEEIATVLDAATAPAKARLPVALRVWASSETPLLSLYQISTVISAAAAFIVTFAHARGYTVVTPSVP